MKIISIAFSFMITGVFALFPLSLFSETAWHCTVQDGEDKEWVGIHYYQRAALNIAYDECKKSSQLPQSCKATSSNCDSYVDGFSTRPLWQCGALDKMAMFWKSDGYRRADDAVLAAKAFCQDRSAMPETCYTTLLMCKNLNPLD